jgi:hypothetical protein
MKKAFAAGGVSASKFIRADSLDEAKEAASEIGYPVVVKCVDSSGSRGINVVVYDNDTHHVVNTACFDTYAAATREVADRTSPEELIAQGNPYSSLTPEQKSLYRYNMRALHTARTQQVIQGTHVPYVAQFLQDYAGNANVRVLLTVKDEAAQVLSAEDCQALAEMGFTDLATLGYRESYCGVQDPDDTIIEQRTSSRTWTYWTEVGCFRWFGQYLDIEQ